VDGSVVTTTAMYSIHLYARVLQNKSLFSGDADRDSFLVQ
jgi:hypothetical protein